ncbi:MAG: hypothetical protein HQ582_24250 [Planctomycetes bacterium]|nr:hypothetical protein [Planctomycetota bacterium]
MLKPDVGRPLAYKVRGDQFGVFVQSRPEVHVADVVSLDPLLDGESSLLLGHERPDFIQLDMGQRQPP